MIKFLRNLWRLLKPKQKKPTLLAWHMRKFNEPRPPATKEEDHE